MELPPVRKLIGKIHQKGEAVHPQENSYQLYETILQLFTVENDTVGHIYCNVGKLGGVASSMNRSFWGVEPSEKMIDDGTLAVAEYILQNLENDKKKEKRKSKVSLLQFELMNAEAQQERLC
jgi:DNA modification methylase